LCLSDDCWRPDPAWQHPGVDQEAWSTPSKPLGAPPARYVVRRLRWPTISAPRGNGRPGMINFRKLAAASSGKLLRGWYFHR